MLNPGPVKIRKVPTSGQLVVAQGQLNSVEGEPGRSPRKLLKA